MKFLVLSFLFLAAVQGRSQNGEYAAVLGENPYLVHIRVAAVHNDGYLSSCVGSLIGSSWVLTSAYCVRNSRFMWLRFGAVDVTRPELVAEGNFNVRVHDDLALINVNRVIADSKNIGKVVLAEPYAEVPASGKFCGFGFENYGPGNQLICAQVPVYDYDFDIVADTDATEFDLGAPLVSDGVQIGVLVSVEESSVFAPVAHARDWIWQVAGV